MNLKKQIFLISLMLLVLSFFSIYLLTLPSFIDHFNLSSTAVANIGTTLSGIVTPIFTFLSIILIYITIYKQSENNRQQTSNNDANMIINLMGQLQGDLDRLTSVIERGQSDNRVTEVKTGYEALFTWVNSFDFKRNPHLLGHFVDVSAGFLLLTRSLNLIKNQISIANFDNKTLELFEAKLAIIYKGYYQYPFVTFINNSSDIATLPAEIKEIEMFVKDFEKLAQKFN